MLNSILLFHFAVHEANQGAAGIGHRERREAGDVQKRDLGRNEGTGVSYLKCKD